MGNTRINKITSSTLGTPIGELLIAATEKGICLLDFIDMKDRLEKQLARVEKLFCCKAESGNNPHLERLETELDAYFSGKRQVFDVPLHIKGTDFQQQAWQALLHIPYGETRSYQQQAEAINNPKAVRAVASANHHNKIAIIIPCHRVIAKNGSMAGYGGEIWRKEFLIELERQNN
jgi:AraC family transcriptional regulator of adaptative response/methylated-DNA-[protein]-cysteine methyltransferase